MKQTIQLKAQSGAVLNILLKRNEMCILGTWYKVSTPTDAMRLLMNMENQIKRSENYHNGVYVYPSNPHYAGDEDAWQDANQSFNKTER